MFNFFNSVLTIRAQIANSYTHSTQTAVANRLCVPQCVVNRARLTLNFFPFCSFVKTKSNKEWNKRNKKYRQIQWIVSLIIIITILLPVLWSRCDWNFPFYGRNHRSSEHKGKSSFSGKVIVVVSIRECHVSPLDFLSFFRSRRRQRQSRRFFSQPRSFEVWVVAQNRRGIHKSDFVVLVHQLIGTYCALVVICWLRCCAVEGIIVFD